MPRRVAGLGGSALVEQGNAQQHGQVLTIGSPAFQLERGAASPPSQLGATGLQEPHRAWRDERIPGKLAGVHLLAGVADHFQKGVIGFGDVALDVSEDDTQDIGFDQATETGLAFTMVAFGSLAVGQIGGDTEEAIDFALGIKHGRHREQDAQPRAIFADVGPLTHIMAPPAPPLDERVKPFNPGSELGGQPLCVGLNFLGIVNPQRRRNSDHFLCGVSQHAARLPD